MNRFYETAICSSAFSDCSCTLSGFRYTVWGIKKSEMENQQRKKSKSKTEKGRDKLMEKHIYDEKNGLSYTLHGDYYLPDLALNEEEPIYGKYGMLRKQFLKEHRLAKYQYLLLTGKLTEHLNQIDQESREQVEMLM